MTVTTVCTVNRPALVGGLASSVLRRVVVLAASGGATLTRTLDAAAAQAFVVGGKYQVDASELTPFTP